MANQAVEVEVAEVGIGADGLFQFARSGVYSESLSCCFCSSHFFSFVDIRYTSFQIYLKGYIRL